MIRTFKALSALLTYPQPDIQDAVGEIPQMLEREGILSPDAIVELQPLIWRLQNRDIYELQENFVLLFDRSRTLSLNLFEHVHGESRDRGGAMVDLLEIYRAGGMEPEGPELPDHLPMLLEYLSTRPLAEGKEMLGDAGHILIALAERLERRKSDYAPVFRALVEIADAEIDEEALSALVAEEDDDPEDLEALDAVWEEAAVTFGPDPNAGCPVSRDLLSRMTPSPNEAAREPNGSIAGHTDGGANA